MRAASSGSHLSPFASNFSVNQVSKGPSTSTRHRKIQLSPTLVVQQLLAGLGRVLGVGALDDGINGTRLLAEAAVDALCHVDVVAGGAAGAVGALLGLDGDGLRRADGLAQLAGDAALLARRVAPQGVLASEAGGDGALLEGVVDCVSVWWSAICCVSVCICQSLWDMPPSPMPASSPQRYHPSQQHPRF